jgi:hypothetical protein
LVSRHLREGRTALSGLVRNNAERTQVTDILEEFDPVHMDDGTELGAVAMNTVPEQGEYAPAVSSRRELQRQNLQRRPSRSFRS